MPRRIATRVVPPANAAGESRDLVSHAYEQLKRLIVLGRLSPGSRIIESDLATRLGVSRTPVRSALQRLQQEGYVQGLEGGKHARLMVAPLTEEDGRELLNLLGSLEALGARWVASLASAERQGLAADLRELNRRFEEVLQHDAPDPDEVFRVHTLFHTRHLQLIRAPRLLAMHASVGPQAERYRRVYITSAPRGFQGEVEQHEHIIRSIERGDPDAAQLAVQQNWEQTAERLGQIIGRMGARGHW
jgi:DNA-binding GntR family transcriptional regulator